MARTLDDIEAEIKATQARLSTLWSERRALVHVKKSAEKKQQALLSPLEQNVNRIKRCSPGRSYRHPDTRLEMQEAVQHILSSGQYEKSLVVKAIRIAGASGFDVDLPKTLDLRHHSRRIINEIGRIYASAGIAVIDVIL